MTMSKSNRRSQEHSTGRWIIRDSKPCRRSCSGRLRCASLPPSLVRTRDIGLLKRKAVVRGQWLRSRDPERQVEELIDALHLTRAFRPFARCMTCNGLLAIVSRKDVSELVPPRVYRRFRAFRQCGDCRRVYWRGTHFTRLQRLVTKAKKL